MTEVNFQAICTLLTDFCMRLFVRFAETSKRFSPIYNADISRQFATCKLNFLSRKVVHNSGKNLLDTSDLKES